MTSPILQNVAHSRMIFKADGYVWSIRTRATIGLRLPTRRAPTRLLRLAIEATQALLPIASRIFSLGEGHRRLISNLCRAFEAAGKPFLRSLVHDSNQTTRGIFFRFIFPPVPFVAAASHDENSSSGVMADETNNRFQIRQEYYRG